MTDFVKAVRVGTLESEDFAAVVRPGMVPYNERRGMDVFCKIEFKGGKLSISGVEGPLASGDCLGSCGQIDMHLREPEGLKGFRPADGWTLDLMRQFLAIWGRWHLNDMRAYDEEMAAAGWPELARTPMLGFEFTLTREAMDARKAAETAALGALKTGETFTPTAEQMRVAALPYSHKVWIREGETEPAPLPDYERRRDLYGHNKGGLKPAERKTLGWLSPADHPDGLLGRKLRPDGNGYGSAWYRQDVPADVLAFLKALPPTDKTPAWV